jgi:hypothetical protein
VEDWSELRENLKNDEVTVELRLGRGLGRKD